MYVCIYIYIYLYIYIYIYVCVCVCVCVYIYIYIYIYVCMYIDTRIFKHCIYTNMYVCMYVCMYVYIYIYIYIYTHIYIHHLATTHAWKPCLQTSAATVTSCGCARLESAACVPPAYVALLASIMCTLSSSLDI